MYIFCMNTNLYICDHLQRVLIINNKYVLHFYLFSMFSYISTTFDVKICFFDLEASTWRWSKPIFDLWGSFSNSKPIFLNIENSYMVVENLYMVLGNPYMVVRGRAEYRRSPSSAREMCVPTGPAWLAKCAFPSLLVVCLFCFVLFGCSTRKTKDRLRR